MNLLNKKVRLLSEDEIYPGMFDLPKGLFMLTVIFSHCMGMFFHVYEHETTSNFIASCFITVYNVLEGSTIPLLFLICGFGWRKRTMQKTIKAEGSWFLRPYLLVSAIIFLSGLIAALVNKASLGSAAVYFGTPFLLGLCPGQIPYFGIETIPIGVLWCMVTYVFSGILLNAVLHAREGWAQWVIIVLLAAVGVMLKNVALPFCFQQALVCTGYMYVGYRIKKSDMLAKEVPLYMLVFVIPFVLISFKGNYLDFSAHIWTNGLSDLFFALLGAFLLLILLMKCNDWQGKFIEWIRWIGRNIFFVCCAHNVWIMVPQIFLGFSGYSLDRLLELPKGQKIVWILLLSAIQLLLACGSVYLVKKIQSRSKKNPAAASSSGI